MTLTEIPTASIMQLAQRQQNLLSRAHINADMQELADITAELQRRMDAQIAERRARFGQINPHIGG